MRIVKIIQRWISKNKTALFTGVCGIVLALLGSLVIAPNLNHVSLQVGCQELNLAVLFSFAIGLILIVIALCWHTHGSWIVPSILIIFLGLIVFGSYMFLAFVQRVKTAQEAQTLLTAGAIAFAAFSAMAAIIGLFFGRKVEKLVEIEKRANEVAALTVTGAELAFAALPDFTESQQIPEKSREILMDITRDIFGQDKALLDFLDKRGNGMKLRYARGLALFADRESAEAQAILSEIVDKAKGQVVIKSKALHRLGIVYRQDGFYRKSIKCFLDLARNNRGNKGSPYFEDIAKIGTAITLRAMWKDDEGAERWTNLSDRIKNKLLEDLGDVFGNLISGVANPAKKWALTLVATIWSSQPSNPLVSGYLAKIYREDNVDDKDRIVTNPIRKKPSDIVDVDSKIKDAAQTVIDYVNNNVDEKSLNIKANYFSAQGLCYYYNGSAEAKDAWERAKNVAKCYKRICKEVYIYSEMKEREIPVSEFIKEIDEEFLPRIQNEAD